MVLSASAVKKRPSAATEEDIEAKKLKQEQEKRTKSQKDLRGWAKYAGGKDDAETSAAKDAHWKMYVELPPDKKNSFLDRWKASPNKKDTSWHKDFCETLEKTKTVDRKKLTGVFTRQSAHVKCNLII